MPKHTIFAVIDDELVAVLELCTTMLFDDLLEFSRPPSKNWEEFAIFARFFSEHIVLHTVDKIVIKPDIDSITIDDLDSIEVTVTPYVGLDEQCHRCSVHRLLNADRLRIRLPELTLSIVAELQTRISETLGGRVQFYIGEVATDI